MAASEGGYECEFVEQLPKVLQSECPVCLLVLRDPYQVTCCGYSYCERCIMRIRASRQSCPTCKEKNFSLFQDKRLQRALSEFKVRCTYRRDGCEWVGQLADLDGHVSAPATDIWGQIGGCQFAILECLYCREPFQRRHIFDHQDNDCPKRLFTCEYCREFRGRYEDVISEHLDECPSVPVPCPNGCGARPERQNVEKHENTVCPLAYTNCDFFFARCAVRPLRKDMAIHLAENLTTHLSFLGIFADKEEGKFQELKEEFEEQQSECEEVRVQMDTINDSNQTLKTLLRQQNSVIMSLKKEVEDLKEEMIDLRPKQVDHMATELLGSGVPQPIDTTNPQAMPMSAADVVGIMPSQAHVDAVLPQIPPTVEVPPHDSEYEVPVTFTFEEFEEYKNDNDTWLSPAFYTHPHGYLMCLSVDANGYGSGKGTHISVYVCLMRGMYDDSLKWPFVGDITIQLLNQMSDQEHHTEVIKIMDTTAPKISGRVFHEGRGDRKGHHRFVSHSMRVLGYNQLKQRMYLRNNTLQFRIKAVAIH